jgi:hypothetical protein
MTVRIIKKPPVPTKQATIVLIKVKSCNALLRMLLTCISIYIESVLRYKFVILDTYPDIYIYAIKDVRIRGYFSKPKGVRDQKSLGNTGLDDFVSSHILTVLLMWSALIVITKF